MFESGDQNQSNESASLGEILQRAREEKQWTIEVVAQRLKLSHGVVRSLENDSNEKEINSMYYRGYLTSYMRLLGLDVKSMLGMMPAAKPRVFRSQELDSLSDLPVFRHTRPRKGVMRKLTLAVVAVLVLMVGVWRYQQSHHESSKIVIPEIQASAQQALTLPQNQDKANSSGFTISPVKSGVVTGK